MRPPLVLLALLVAAPVASACSLASPKDFDRLVWADDARVLANDGWDFGFAPIAGRGFEKVATPFALTPPVASPDGRWLAWQEATGLGGDCSPIQGLLLARGPDGRRQVVREKGAWSYAATDEVLAVWHRDEANVTLYRWDRWDSPRVVPLDGEPATRLLASPDGRWLAAHADRTLLVADLRTGEVAHRFEEEGNLWGFDFSPDGTKLVLFSGLPNEPATLRVVGLPDGAETARTTTGPGVGVGLSWGRPGLAYALARHEYRGEGELRTDLTLRVARPENLSVAAERRFEGFRIERSLLWTPDGRLLVGAQGELRVYDAALEEVGAKRNPVGASWAPLLAAAMGMGAVLVGRRR